MPTALVTGASAGIGAAFAQELAAQGYDLVLVARSTDKLAQLAAQLTAKHEVATQVIVQDLTAPDAAAQVQAAVEAESRTIDVLVNNAGFGEYGPFTQVDRQRQLNMIQLNVVALVDLTYRFLTDMQQRRAGAIVNVASTAAYQAMPYIGVYGATKAFVLSFSEALWAENQTTGVRVFAVCPGPTKTDFFKDAEFPEPLVKQVENTILAPEEVAQAAIAHLHRNDSNLVPGGFLNKLLINMPRLLPRETLAQQIAQQFRPR